MEAKWTAVDQYLTKSLLPFDDALASTLTANTAAGLPPHDVAPNQGKFLMLLAQMQGAKNVLEIGTLGGYSTIWLARGVGKSGRVTTVESNHKHVQIAESNITRAGLDDRVAIHHGPALSTLPDLQSAGADPFDMIFIDADKPNNPAYLEWAMKLSRPGTVIIADNVVRDGAVIDPDSADDRVQGVRRFLEMVSKEPRLSATALQTVGEKGWDGFVFALVLDVGREELKCRSGNLIPRLLYS